MGNAEDVVDVVRFGRWTVVMHRRELLRDGQRAELGGRAFDLLAALIEGRGKVLSNQLLMNRIWPGRVVEENSLHAHVSALRHAFGPERGLIRTVSGRGYQFTGELRFEDAVEPASEAPEIDLQAALRSNLPQRATELIGREHELLEVTQLLQQRRLLTLVGAAGIGKTSLSLEAARQAQPHFPCGVRWAELGALTDPELVAPTVANALGLTLSGGVLTTERIASALGGQRLLLVLDTCEHLIEEAARAAEMLLQASAGICLMATSREPLRIAAEYVYRVPPLEVPSDDAQGELGAMGTGALRLFLSRALAVQPQLVADASFAVAATAICRRLDGIPLAIELAAARSASLSMTELSERLDDRFRLLAGGRRTALPRHQTLRAAIDWSYDLLSSAEQVVLRRMAVFTGSFSLEAAAFVARDNDISEPEAADFLGNLVAKSLVAKSVLSDTATAKFHLLDSMRAYATEKLFQADESPRCARLHATHYTALMEGAVLQTARGPSLIWLTSNSQHLDNVRTALDWAFSASGDADLAETLTLATVPLWMHLSLVNECRKRVLQALGSGTRAANQNRHHDMRLYAALGSTLIYTSMGPQAHAAWTYVLEIAEDLGDVDYKLRALWGLWVDALNGSEFRQSLALARRFLDAAKGSADRDDVWIGERIVGVSLHFMGEQAPAEQHISRMLAHYVGPKNSTDVLRFQFDQKLTARCFLSRIRWLRGYPDEALHIVQSAIADAQSTDHNLSLINSLGQGACLVALFCGDLALAERFTALLLDRSARDGISLWHAWARCFSAALLVRRGQIDAGLRLFRSELTTFTEMRRLPRYLTLLGELAQGLGQAGEGAEGLVLVNEALMRNERNEERWYLAELLRIKGELLLGQGDTAAAGQHFERSLRCAEQQQTLSWALRSASSLARWQLENGQRPQAIATLNPVYLRFTEGFETSDLVAARALLAQLA